jgi:hypothetical protein
MPKALKPILLSIVFALLIGLAKPGLSQSVTPAEPATTSPVINLDREFWLADGQALHTALTDNQVSVERWLQDLNQSALEFLCLGETHNPAFRQFLAQAIFPQLDVDVLMLEADAPQAEELVSQVKEGRSPVTLLGVDIAAVLQAAQRRNPDVQIVGVDETDQQTAWKNLEQANSDRRYLSRDGFIAQNIRDAFQAEQQHVALYGANHCARHDLGLGNVVPMFRQVAGKVSEADRSQTVLILSSGQSNPLTIAFQRANLSDRAFVIPDTQAIDPAVYNYRWDLKSFFDNYDAIVYFPVP